MKINISASIFIAIIIILFNYGAFASRSKVKIVTSITPLASIIAMLVKDQAEIVAIANNNDCPHHYNLRPSDLKKVKNADIVFYIDEQFDGFAGKLMNGHSKNVIKISNFNGLRVISNNSYDNWHIWLDLDNVKLLLEQLFQVLSQRFPEISSAIYQNLEEAKKQIEALTKIKHQRLTSLTDVILLSDSLEYFFNNSQKNVARLYSSDQKSLRYISNLEHLLSMSNSKCLLLSTEQDVALYKNFKVEVVEVESENWQATNINSDLFYNQYLKIINQVSKCLNNNSNHSSL
ncbi:metal ABC transporter substrate-binding protein [Rickettsia endosymbiont of Culicoides newsteadi]|uniref:metal ABC transporter substrate-binding protein n=1 Tax=Rickettsia endosymbiont of Culicoides newsteadi TaxID=1961830 RepID=UPI000B9AC20C|nr:metal ABC transporter substrate-binding protein [Rickettsia endosymbiont of Culicoides newsteadi]OZG32090.1 zinc ABC transporter substrate-binding protein [Rickettsia endosymbiont of Culicoides newsteadi]